MMVTHGHGMPDESECLTGSVVRLQDIPSYRPRTVTLTYKAAVREIVIRASPMVESPF